MSLWNHIELKWKTFSVKKLLRKLVKYAKETIRMISIKLTLKSLLCLICDERARVFPLQPIARSSKATKLNILPVLLLPVHNILLPAERLHSYATYIRANGLQLAQEQLDRKLKSSFWLRSQPIWPIRTVYFNFKFHNM